MKNRISLSLIVALVAAGCAQSNGDVNRVQPNVVRKTDLLDGQWFFRNTVAYTPFSTGFTIPGMTGGTEKLVWEIQEGFLVGYRSYPYILGAEAAIDPTSLVSGTTTTACNAAGECKGGQQYYGAPVVAFAIKSHFDIQRAYNPATGEATNVVQENITDRPWNQREFIRVDWSANLLAKNLSVNWGPVLNPSNGSSSSSWIQPNETAEDPYDWPSFEYDADGKLKYFDLTVRYLANPDHTYYPRYNRYVPNCWFNYGEDCSSAEIKVRMSVARVDAKWTRDYEPLQYPNELMSVFGYFRTDRLNWDKKFGFNDSAVVRLANRHRVWEHFYETDAAGNPDPTRPLPLASRTPKPLVYYLSRADRMGGQARYDLYWPMAQELEHQYDPVFRRAIAAAQGKAPEAVPQMFFVCHNPVHQADRPECGAAGFSPKFGDLRYSFLNNIAESAAGAPLGLGQWAPDPETGQIISGIANVYLWDVDLIARRVTNHILLQEGLMDTTWYVSGQQTRNYLSANPAYNINQVQQQANNVQAELQGTPQRGGETQGAWERPTARMAQVRANLLAEKGPPHGTGRELEAAAERLSQFPELEAAVLDNPDVQADLANLLPPFAQARAQADPAYLRDASKDLLENMESANAWEQARLDWLSTHNVTMAEFWDSTLISLAREMVAVRAAGIAALQAQGIGVVDAARTADDEITDELRKRVWLATALHEVGHTVGLRHNFQGSFDAINYFDQYWDLKKQSITVMQAGVPQIPRTPNDLKAASSGTTDQLNGGIHDFEYSSIMDYSGKRNGDWKGLGKYDAAAVLFAYSGTTEPGFVEVFAQPLRLNSKGFPGSDGAVMTVSGAGADMPMVNATHLNPNVPNYTERFHYSMVPLHLGNGNDLTSVIADGIVKLRSRRLEKWSQVQADEARVAELLRADPTLALDPDRAGPLLGNPLVRVPYMFCSDESADGPVLSCNRFDRGPDYFEINRTRLEDYWNYYLDTHFKLDRLSFSGRTAVTNTFKTFEKVSDSYKHWVNAFYRHAASSQEQTPQYKLDPLLQDTWTMAVLDGVNQHLNVFSVPPYGLMMYRPLTTGAQWDLLSAGDDWDSLNADGQGVLEGYYSSRYGATDFTLVPKGIGRRTNSRYDFRSGYGFFNRMVEAGQYNDELGAMFAAVDSKLEVQGADVTADQNRYRIPYYLVFREEFAHYFGAMWANNEQARRPVLYKMHDSAGLPIGDPNIVWNRQVSGTDFFVGFDYPAAAPQPCTAGQNPGTSNPPACFSTDMSAAPANISTTWTSRIYALMLGMSQFRVNFDMDYAKQNQVFKLGGQEQFTVAPGYHTVDVIDPLVGAHYAAIEQDGAGPDSTPAVRMVRLANIYLTMYQDPTICPLDPFLLYLGYACLSPKLATNPALVEDRRRYWQEIFQNSIRDLDLMRGMYAAYGRPL